MILSKSSGFSLIELLVVIVIIGLTAGVGVANFRDFGRRQDVNNYFRSLDADLHAIHSDASAGRRLAGCTGTFNGYEISFTATSVAGGSRSTSYTVSSSCSTASIVSKTVTLPSTMYLLINRVPTSGVVKVLFKPLELGTDVSAANPLTLTLSSSSTTETKMLTILATGEIQ